MKTIEIPFLPLPTPDASLERISVLLDEYEQHWIENGWFNSYPYQPKVAFSAAHGGNCFYLKYYVYEQPVLARFVHSNDPVYKDSCVELFITFDKASYYNLEFNSLGTCLMEFGPHRQDRIKAQPLLIHKIKRYGSYINDPNQPDKPVIAWQLTLIIPVEIFEQHSIASFSGKRIWANFQKCGDDTPQPHFLSWNKIDTPAPDFHQPHFFGELRFL